MGAYTKQDVLDALDDPILSRISIVCEGLLVSSFTLGLVKGRISSGDITVVEGTSDDNAYYNAGSDTLTTHKGPTPMPFWKKSVLIHECTHALMDVLEYETTTLTNELICYITQVAFEIMSDPRYKY